MNFFAYLRRSGGRLGLLGAGLLTLGAAHGQAPAAADSVLPLGPRLSRYVGRTPVEKLFMHLDRPAYVSGETMWFKLYAVEGTHQQPLASSSVAYVEVLNQAQVPVLQARIPLRHASGQGSLVLPAGLPSGRYTVRAYTSWMQNFGADYYFHTTVVVVNAGQPLGPAAARPAVAYDPQFFPEGGYLVQGLASQVGFKLTDDTGHGLAAEGTVLDAVGTTVAHFRTLWAGIGSFSFTPAQAGAGYRAVIKLANQHTITCALPAVRPQGYVLHLEEAGPTQLRLTVQARGAAASETLFLLGHARQQVVLAAEGQLYNGQVVFTVPKQPLAAGVAHFTLFDGQRRPVCERLYFSPPAAPLALSAQPDQLQYAARQRVTLKLAAAGPLPANLSVAVYQLDSLSAAGGPDINSYLWLASDLRGPVENPARYLDATNPEAAAAADNLMLTQGWSRYRWAGALAGRPDSLPHLPELNGPLLQGRVVSTLTGQPAESVPVYLATPSRRIRLYNSISRADGSILFELPDLYGPRQLIAQTDTQRDSTYRIELRPSFSAHYAAEAPAPLTLSERVAASLLRRYVQAQVQQRYPSGPPARYQAPALDTTAFFGPPSEHYLLDKYTRFKVMEEVMREYVPGVLVRIHRDGFHFLVPDNNSHSVMDTPLVLLDGVPVFSINRIMAFDPLKVQQLDVLTARYFLGPVIHTGIVSYTTYKGDLAGLPLDTRALLQEYEGLQGQRDFYAPRYDTPAAAQSSLPDFRNLLYWNPQVLTQPGETPEINFYTSDQVGRYRVVVQGLTPAGLAGSTSATFEVKAPL